MSFSYNPVEIDKVNDVTITGGEVSQKNHSGDNGSNSLTKEQKRKRQMVEFLEAEFQEFHEYLDELIAGYHGFGRRKEFISDTIGVPDYFNCENCNNLGESENGKPICMKTAEKKDGKRLYKVIPDTSSIPSFCKPGMRWMDFPEDRLKEVDDDIYDVAVDGYEEYAQQQRENCLENRERALEEGRQNSDYVTKDIDELVDSREEYAADELDKLVRNLFEPRDFSKFKSAALRLAWLVHLDDTLQEEFHPQRGEAYLRAMDSTHAEETTPGAGGDEFEASVRDFIDNLGWPLKDRVIQIDGDTRASRKEMDILTEIGGATTIVEVYTAGAHNSKEQQVQDYRDLYEMATGECAQTLLLTDAASHCRVSLEFLSTLLRLDCGDEHEVPGEYHDLDLERWDDEPDAIGDAGSSYKYEFEDFTHKPPERCVKVEKRIENCFENASYDVSKPYSSSRFWHHAVGPTITFDEGEYRHSIVFHGGRSNEWDATGRGPEVSTPDHWRGWVGQLTDTERVTVLEVTEDSEEPHLLTPRLLQLFLDTSVDPTGLARTI